MTEFFTNFWHYFIDVLPSLVIGLVLGGIVHEFLPEKLVEKHLTERGVLPILYVTAVGVLLPVCCFGSLPIACAFRKKGVPLGPVLAFLVAAPATSVTAILVTWKLLGWQFTLVLCAGVVLMGLVMGLIGNMFEFKEETEGGGVCPMCQECDAVKHRHHQKGAVNKVISILYYAFIDMPREMGLEILIGIALAAAVSSIAPVRAFIGHNFSGFAGYIFALVFGIVMYICSTASVPLACAFIASGMNVGAGMVLLLAGPITSYGALLIIKKEFGVKVLVTYVLVISIMSVLLGYAASHIINYLPCVKSGATEIQDIMLYALKAGAAVFGKG
jgi:hypothetical protein